METYSECNITEFNNSYCQKQRSSLSKMIEPVRDQVEINLR